MVGGIFKSIARRIPIEIVGGKLRTFFRRGFLESFTENFSSQESFKTINGEFSNGLSNEFLKQFLNKNYNLAAGEIPKELPEVFLK